MTIQIADFQRITEHTELEGSHRVHQPILGPAQDSFTQCVYSIVLMPNVQMFLALRLGAATMSLFCAHDVYCNAFDLSRLCSTMEGSGGGHGQIEHRRARSSRQLTLKVLYYR